MKQQTKLLLACTVLAMSQMATAKDLTVVSFGGAVKDAQVKAYYGPYKAATGTQVLGSEYNGEMAKIKSMVDTKTISWDVVEVESPELTRGCEEGLFEKIDITKIGNKADFVPGAVQQCGVATFVWTTGFAYDGDKLKVGPKSWADFWDVKKFPGKRGMRKGPKYSLEFALMADGVAPKDVYKMLATPKGVDRAFKKLDQLKPYIQWWEAGAQPAQYLAAGDVVMSVAYNGRIANAQKEGKNLKMVWNGSIYDMDFWAIPKGHPAPQESLKYIAFASKPENQKIFSGQISYGPTNKKTLPLIPKADLANLPTAPNNLKNSVGMDTVFWADYGESLEQRFNAWAAK
ncbi:ABC transporter substrate-binding protein [Leeia sp. TBRC 13508]|uniref:ABC transporter substrate-binding protein n=1 Tax=Leeia speluncae TaxID=2884804 RepID=A0ABS8D4J1_9NEIS|nr:ABC transporter substrate-binding protein [Leeia speluncae]MCB6183042.1 ABC transporter substrate-binding protein [Leeia speluncae]